jgi:signal-transduction protein with cAMP-binding, CBS, and nucleotidyltransferase domain
VEHLASAGISPAMEREIVYLEKDSRLEESDLGIDERVKNVLSTNTLFGKLPDAEVNHLSGYVKVAEYKAGKSLFRQGNKGASMFILMEGLLNSEVKYQEILDSILHESIQPTEHFGEECVLGPNVRAATVKAVTDCLVVEISAKAIMEVAGRNGTFLTLLNQETSLSKIRSIEGKHKVSKPSGIQDKKSLSKKPLSSSIQTFFTDLFPSPPTSKKSKL